MQSRSTRRWWIVPAIAMGAWLVAAAIVETRAPGRRPARAPAGARVREGEAAGRRPGTLPTPEGTAAKERKVAPPRHAPPSPPAGAGAAEGPAAPMPPTAPPRQAKTMDDDGEARRPPGVPPGVPPGYHPRRTPPPQPDAAPSQGPAIFVPATPPPEEGPRGVPPAVAGDRDPERPRGLASLSGRVIEAGTSEGIAGAAVEVTPQGGGSERRRVIASTDGSYVLANLGEGTYVVQASRLGYAPLTLVLALGRDGASRDLGLAPMAGGTGSAVLAGRVTDAATRAPIRSARVTVRAQGGAPRTGTVDAEGRFRIANLAAGDVRLLVTAGRYRAEETVVTLSAGETRRDVSLVSESSIVATLTGQVLSRTDGAPIQARLVLRPVAGGAPLVSGSDLEGAFRFERLAPGEWLLAVEAEGFLPSERPIRMEAGRRHEQVLLDPAWGTLAGEVVSRGDQAAIAGAVVRVDGDEGWTATTDEAGAFQIDLVATGTRRLHVDAEGFGGASLTLPVLGGGQKLVVELDPIPQPVEGE